MRDSRLMPIRSSLVFAAMLLGAPAVAAQGFSADYGLARTGSAAPAAVRDASFLSFGQLRVAPALHSDGKFAGGGLSVAAGQHWFAEFAVGRNLSGNVDGTAGVPDLLRVGGGYRWDDGQSLSLQVTGARGGSRLGLSLSYDWPRYFVRLGYDGVLTPAQQDKLRFSAGVRF